MAPITRTRFGDKLRGELDRQHLSVRKLARMISPEQPEPMRRNLARWIGGYNRPSRIHRVMVAEALGVPVETFDEDDEEGDIVVALVRAIRAVVREELDSREKREVEA